MTPQESLALAAQCRDWLCAERDRLSAPAIPYQRLTSFITALDVLLGHVASQGTRLEEARAAAKAYAEQVTALGAAAPDTREVMATALSIAKAESDLFFILGLRCTCHLRIPLVVCPEHKEQSE